MKSQLCELRDSKFQYFTDIWNYFPCTIRESLLCLGGIYLQNLYLALLSYHEEQSDIKPENY